MMIGTWLRLRSCRQTSMPLSRGSITSSSTRSGRTMSKRSSASNPSRGDLDREALAAQADRQRLDEARLVLDDEHRRDVTAHWLDGLLGGVGIDGWRSGMRRTNVEPSPSCDDTSTSPPWLVATWRTIARPSPVPPVSRLRPLSTR